MSSENHHEPNTDSGETVRILGYSHQNKGHFFELNRKWIEEAAELEAIDDMVLKDPHQYIIEKGGDVLFATAGENIVGTIAYRPGEMPGAVELTKMAVDEGARRMGVGTKLLEASIKIIRDRGFKKIILYSNTRQASAIRLYRKFKFVEIPLKDSPYKRANIKMELDL